MEKNQKQETKPSKEELLKGVQEVLEEALAEYEALTKMDMSAGDNLQMAEDPSRLMPKEEPKKGDDDGDEDDKEPKSEDKKEEKKDEKKDKEDKKDESDKELEDAYKSLTAKMEERGLLKKAEPTPAPEAPKAEAKVEAPKAEEVKKSEVKVEAPAPADDKTETLSKSVTAQFEALTKTIKAIEEKVEKIASAPAPRKGVAGYAPLKKSEGESAPLRKSEVVNKLLDLKKSGDRRIDTALINRVETDRLSQQDVEFLKGIVA